MFTAAALRNYARLDECAPHVIEDGSDTPADVDMAKINQVIEDACGVLGWDNLTVKDDLVLHNGDVYIIELAARLSGGYFASDIIPAAYGVDMIGAAINLALGQRVKSVETKALGYVCQRVVFPDEADIARKVRDVKSPKLNGEIVNATYHIAPGQVIKRVTSHPARWGQVLAGGESALFARKAAETAVKALKAGVKLS